MDSRRAQVLVREAAGDLSKAIDSMGAVTRRLVRKIQADRLDNAKLNKLLAGGTIEGVPAATLQQFKQEVRKAAVDGTIMTVNTRTGKARFFKPDDYAELVFQTK